VSTAIRACSPGRSPCNFDLTGVTAAENHDAQRADRNTAAELAAAPATPPIMQLRRLLDEAEVSSTTLPLHSLHSATVHLAWPRPRTTACLIRAAPLATTRLMSAENRTLTPQVARSGLSVLASSPR